MNGLITPIPRCRPKVVIKVLPLTPRLYVCNVIITALSLSGPHVYFFFFLREANVRVVSLAALIGHHCERCAVRTCESRCLGASELEPILEYKEPLLTMHAGKLIST